jgi:glycyl-tRNA synthetase alpha subunit
MENDWRTKNEEWENFTMEYHGISWNIMESDME